MYFKTFVLKTTTMIAKEKNTNVTRQIAIKCKKTSTFNEKVINKDNNQQAALLFIVCES